VIEENKDFMKELLGFMLQEVLEYERYEQIGVNKYIRNKSEIKECRNRCKDQGLKTRLGVMSFKEPQIREFPFQTKLFENYQRSERALILAIQQMVIDGVSTNKVKKDNGETIK
jgi:putative transposase